MMRRTQREIISPKSSCNKDSWRQERSVDLFTDVPNSIGSIVSLTKYMYNDFKSPNDVKFLILSFDLELFGSDCGEKRE